MRLPSAFYTAFAGVMVHCIMPASGVAQTRPEFVSFQGAVKGALYKPDSGPAPHVGILVMHRLDQC